MESAPIPVEVDQVRVDVNETLKAPREGGARGGWKMWVGVVAVIGLFVLVAVVVATASAPATCSAIDVGPSTTTAGASCAGGPASDGLTCDFACESGYEITGASSITCGSDGECGEEGVAGSGVVAAWCGTSMQGGWMDGRRGPLCMYS